MPPGGTTGRKKQDLFDLRFLLPPGAGVYCTAAPPCSVTGAF